MHNEIIQFYKLFFLQTNTRGQQNTHDQGLSPNLHQRVLHFCACTPSHTRYEVIVWSRDSCSCYSEVIRQLIPDQPTLLQLIGLRTVFRDPLQSTHSYHAQTTIPIIPFIFIQTKSTDSD